MGGVPCTCGNSIKDNSDSLPHKARFWTDRHIEAFTQELIDGIVATARAHADGTLSEEAGEAYRAKNGGEAALKRRAAKLVAFSLFRWSKSIFQCDQCGRLWLDRPFPPRGFAGFAPEGNWHRALDVVPDGMDPTLELLLRVLEEIRWTIYFSPTTEDYQRWLATLPHWLGEDIDLVRKGDPRGMRHLLDNLGTLGDRPLRDADRAASLRRLLAEAYALAAEVQGVEPRLEN